MGATRIWNGHFLKKRYFMSNLACEASVSVLFWSKGHAKNGASKRLFHVLPLVSFLARPKPRISFLGLSLLRNSTETLATQAMSNQANYDQTS